jgi:hypothetical protein
MFCTLVLFATAALLLVARAAVHTPIQADRNDGIHLPISPECGPLGGNYTNVNAGIDIHRMQTIVVFGVS